MSLQTNQLRYVWYSVGFVVFAVGVVIGVWVYVQYGVLEQPPQQPVQVDLASSTTASVTPSSSPAVIADPVASGTAPSAPLVTESIPLSSVPLSDTQRTILDTLGVDVETDAITPAMAACAEEKLGRARLEEIVAGDAPTAFEAIGIAPCLNQ